MSRPGIFPHPRVSSGGFSIVPFQPTQYKSAEDPKEDNKNLKILVTGCADVGGSPIVDRVARGGPDMVALDNRVTGTRR
jgi:hypothetical protein